MKTIFRVFSIFYTTLLSLSLLLCLTTGNASAAAAHAKVISATPAIGSTISTAPTTITVTTAENMKTDPKLSNLLVYGPNGDLISQGDAKVNITQPTQMSVTIKPDGNGIYVVQWKNVSEDDGDPDQGAFTFTVKPATQNTSTGTTTTAQNTSFPILPVSITGILALLIGLGIGFGFGRKQA